MENSKDVEDIFEVISSWEMDFNRSIFLFNGSVNSSYPMYTDIPEPTTGVNSKMPNWAHFGWIAAFSAMLIVAIGGNSIVIWIVMAHKGMRSVTNYFLVNLSIADLLMAILNCLFNFIYMLYSDWTFGFHYCKISNFIANVTVSASVFTLTGISFDRFQAIVRPMQPRMSKTWSIVMIFIIWLMGMIISIPCFIYSEIHQYVVRGRVYRACILIWPDGMQNKSYLDYIYQIVIFVVVYAIPMLVMTGFYTAMGRVLWGSGYIGELTQRQLESIKSKRKVVKMFILIVVIFGICWFPYHTYFIYMHLNPNILYKRYMQHVYLAFYWMAMGNAMVNPIIYYWMNGKFRTYFTRAICGWYCYIVNKIVRDRPVESPQLTKRHSSSGSKSRSGVVDDYKGGVRTDVQVYDMRPSTSQSPQESLRRSFRNGPSSRISYRQTHYSKRMSTRCEGTNYCCIHGADSDLNKFRKGLSTRV